MITLVILLLTLTIGTYFFMQHPKFGKLPTGERLERIKKSPNFRDGQFQNSSVTPDLTEGANFFTVLKEFIFKENTRVKPTDSLPSVKTNLHEIPLTEDAYVWFGHSSYFLQTNGIKFLIDPVFSGAASPIRMTTKSFGGSDRYTTADIPEIDYLIITHDHWDHLDYKTIKELKSKVKTVICGLGVGEHFEYWGYDKSRIIEKDWNETVQLINSAKLHTTPARHFSGRSFSRNKSLWLSFVLETPNKKIFIGGDGGYDSHFKTIGDQFGPFDLAIIECGQYDKNWKYIHLMPEEVVQVAQDLKVKKLIPVHWSKFSLANHNWDEPISRLENLNENGTIRLCTPMIGEKMDLNADKSFASWWKNVN
ncbi:MBL fold metallo-hydrolase [Flavobacterium cerinum]|uniref:MBL fold metallo-hydrolase n=1 Tax=Flavobacterium cerinum TaxID=2502784 RepID=A0ABY5INF3_9FLAO|nr:MBL fold metallo-hydrolase [Flavobacterium cerinum]UUC44378.1 MBL fold metallo-hydrolase [Flavobacterium cerinum]